jgi:SpoVK/Ycf46/Vps4 family AAA+-type ATPase
MTTVEKLSEDIDRNFEEFRKNFSQNRDKFPQINNFQQKMISKGYMLYQTGDFLSSIIYCSLALWSYGLESKKSDEAISSLRNIITDARQKLKQSYSTEGKGGDNDFKMPDAISPEKLVDKSGQLINFNTMVGALNEKQNITTKFIYPILHPFLFLSDTNNILLYGPAGTGKTFLVKASVSELNRMANGKAKYIFFDMTADKVRSKWEGGTEKNIASMFQIANKRAIDEQTSSRIPTKSVIFLDEVEAIAKSREKGGSDRSVTTLLQQMDGISKYNNIVVMAATNFPWELDSAFVRRFTGKIFVDLPDFVTRVDLIMKKIISKYIKHNDFRRLLSFKLVESRDNNYKYKSTTNSTVDEEIKNMIRSVDDDFINDVKKHIKTNDTTILNYTIYIMHYIKTIVESKIRDIDFDYWIEIKAGDYYELVKFIFLLADKTGPSLETYNQLPNYLKREQKRHTNSAITKYGYSASELENVVNEFFNLTANEIIHASFYFNKDSKCDENYITNKQSNCYIKHSKKSFNKNNKEQYTAISESSNITNRFVDDNYNDLYSTFMSDLFYGALNNYKSVIGVDDNYCNYIEYDLLPQDPTSKETCRKLSFGGGKNEEE